MEWSIVACANCFTMIMIGGGLMQIFLTKDIISDFGTCNKIAKKPTKRSELFIKFSELVQIHSDATR